MLSIGEGKLSDAGRDLLACHRLGAYRQEHRSYPASLAELVPAYLDEVPKDPFSGDDFRYQPQLDSYVLYGVGPNRRDDGGRAAGDGAGADDIVIRITPTPPKQRE